MILPYRIINLEQGSDEWKQERLKYVTASQVPVLLDLSPYQTTLGLFEEKVLGQEPPITTTQQILFDRGHKAEAIGRQWVKDNLGLDFKPAVVVSTEVLDLLASLDGFIENDKIIFEAKYMGAKTLLDVKAGKIPEHHKYQVQAQLLATGADHCIYFAMDGKDSAWIRIFPDTKCMEEIKKSITKFMNCVRKGEAPEPSERDFHSPEDARFNQLFNLKLQMEKTKEEFDQLKEKLATEYSHFKRIRTSGITMIRTLRKGVVNYSKVPELKGLDLEQYRGKSSETVTVSFDKAELKNKARQESA